MKLIDTWIGVEGQDENRPFLLRARDSLKMIFESRVYIHRVEITWNYNTNSDKTGLPIEDELQLMEQVENRLVEALESDLSSILVAVYTFDGLKTWFWYAKDVEEFGERLNAALSEFDALPLEIESEEDVNWDVYRSMLNDYQITSK